MGNNMPRMMDMNDWMDMEMIMVPPMMMGKYRNPWSDNNSRNNDMVNEMHHRIDNLEDMVNEMHHRIDDLSSSLENIESMLHELLGRR
jgi:tetrahydromethanopterin S-methyltransferase subunit G